MPASSFIRHQVALFAIVGLCLTASPARALPGLDVRLDALARDVAKFYRAIPEHGPSKAQSDELRALHARAQRLGKRAVSLCSIVGETHPRYRTVVEAYNATRTLTQRSGVGAEHHTPVSVSVLDDASAESATIWKRAVGNKLVPLTRIMGTLSPSDAEVIAARLAQVPASAVALTNALGHRLVLFSGTLTDVHGFRHMRGLAPPGYAAGKTFADASGLALPDERLLAAKAQHELDSGGAHISASLILHEYGHTLDAAIAATDAINSSDSAAWRRGPWRELRRRDPARTSYRLFANEWFAESFARYTKSPASNEELARDFPITHAYLLRRFGTPRF